MGRQNNQVLSGGPIYQRRVHFISRRAIGITHGGPSRRLRFIVRFDPPSSRSSLDRTRLLPLRVLGLVWVTVNGQRSAEQTVTTQDRPRHLIMLQRTRARRKQHEWAENNTRTMRSSEPRPSRRCRTDASRSKRNTACLARQSNAPSGFPENWAHPSPCAHARAFRRRHFDRIYATIFSFRFRWLYPQDTTTRV